MRVCVLSDECRVALESILPLSAPPSPTLSCYRHFHSMVRPAVRSGRSFCMSQYGTTLHLFGHILRKFRIACGLAQFWLMEQSKLNALS